MLLINRVFLIKQLFEIVICQIKFIIKIKNIEIKIHDNFEYVIMNLYFFENIVNKSVII